METNYYQRHGVLCDAQVWCNKVEIGDQVWMEQVGDTCTDICDNLDYIAHRVAGVSIYRWATLRREQTMRFHFETDGRPWVDEKGRRFVVVCLPDRKPIVENMEVISD